jgi:hypothetical protein
VEEIFFEVRGCLGFKVLIAITRNSTDIVPCSSEKTDVSEEDSVYFQGRREKKTGNLQGAGSKLSYASHLLLSASCLAYNLNLKFETMFLRNVWVSPNYEALKSNGPYYYLQLCPFNMHCDRRCFKQ